MIAGRILAGSIMLACLAAHGEPPNPKIVARLTALATSMDAELGGAKGSSGRRPAGEVKDPKPLYPMSDEPRGKKDK